MEKIKVLIIDDSASMRSLLKESLSASPKIEVIATAMDPLFAVSKINSLNPDVITLDIEMPRMDGLTFLSKLMISNPKPVVMVSSLTDHGTKETLKALELGAVDFILKPVYDDKAGLSLFSNELIKKVIFASQVQVNKTAPEKAKNIEDIFIADRPDKSGQKNSRESEFIIAIGSSTGGTVVISDIMQKLADNLPPILIVQHMPEGFTKPFAERLNTISKIFVKEAEQDDHVFRGCAYVASAGRHLELVKAMSGYRINLSDSDPVNRFKPSVEVLYKSVAESAGGKSCAVILTGMGTDGSKAMLELKKKGALTVAQDEKSSAVFGMPREAIRLGAASMVKNIDEIAEFLNSLASV
jgi:two-component system, chemotaxis family, protein-glutamate methylesterase/glutaminase